MALTTTKVKARIEATETASGTFGTAYLDHIIDFSATLASGTGSNQADLIAVSSGNVTDSGTNIDLRGLTSQVDGSTVEIAEVVLFYVKNKSTTSGETISIGGGATEAWTNLFNGAADEVVIGPGGVFLWSSPVDGGALVDNTSDKIELVASSGDTIAYDLVAIGRSA